MVKIRNLSKTYAKSSVKAVDNISLELEGGEIFGFLGPNGAGKTTTIKMVTGVLPITSGSIEICGHDIELDPIAAKREIGYVSDTHIIYDRMTGMEYVNFMADVFGVGAERKERTERLLELFKLTDAASSSIKSYSHGMRQKIAVIGALVHEPKVWILDEPMTGLDPQSFFDLKNLMRQHADNGNIVFFSTHIVEVAEKLCDKIAVINKGKIVVNGTMEQIKQTHGDKSLETIFLEVAR